MGVEKRIKDLTMASSITNNDYLAMDNANNLAAKKTSAMPLRNVNAIANIQNNLVANKAYAIGEQFVYQGNVYQATAAIASGATITINGNCALAYSLADQITALNNDLNGYIDLTNRSSSRIGGHLYYCGHIALLYITFPKNAMTINTNYDCGDFGVEILSMIYHSSYILNGRTFKFDVDNTTNHLIMKTSDALPSGGIPALNGIIPLIVG